MPITVPYSPLLEESEGFREGVAEGAGLYADVPYLVLWSDRYQFANDILGSSTWSGTAWTLVAPETYPPSPNMFAREVSIRGHGEPTIGPTQNVQQWSHAIVTVRYQTPIQTFNSIDPNKDNNLGKTPREQDAIALCEQDIDYGCEWYSLPDATMYWKTYGAAPGATTGKQITGQPVRVRVAVQTMTITYNRLPFIPMALNQLYVGRLNKSEFLGCLPESVMYLGCKTNRQIDNTGLLTQKVSMVFKWREQDWQKDLLPDGSAWDRVVTSSGVARYQTRELVELLELKFPTV